MTEKSGDSDHWQPSATVAVAVAGEKHAVDVEADDSCDETVLQVRRQ